MAYEVKLHPKVVKFLDSLQQSQRERCRAALNTLYRLRVGDYRFEYFVENSIVWVVKAFSRGVDY
ncbi:MAG: hypothetical protein HY514_03665 [Candidatus Aenigmarchaeota archaeon]|nr:hypothetical protein [Candidatus Aenigmarchaeota archaeon]